MCDGEVLRRTRTAYFCICHLQEKNAALQRGCEAEKESERFWCGDIGRE